MRLGLTDMIGLAASLIFAIPLGNYALIRLVAGEVALGVGLLVVAAAMVILPQYFLNPGRIVRGLLGGLLPRQLRGDVSDGKSSVAESSAADGKSSVTESSAVESSAAESSATESSAVASADDAPDK